MPEKHKRYFLKAKESKNILKKASEKLNVNLELVLKHGSDVEVFETELARIFLVDGKPVLIAADDNIYPTLKFDGYFHLAPKVVVDMGAIPYVCKGANVMAPGIRKFEGQFDKNCIVFIVDERHRKPIAIGEILYSREEAENIKQGVIVKNVHYVGDKIWNLLKDLP